MSYNNTKAQEKAKSKWYRYRKFTKRPHADYPRSLVEVVFQKVGNDIKIVYNKHKYYRILFKLKRIEDGRENTESSCWWS